ncbi:MAG: hypothetical protein LBM95_10020 [Lactobacillales bacterium]|jgi:hypothetical protein|nr:hypothetical protein [Lactobacillales bacterium]
MIFKVAFLKFFIISFFFLSGFFCLSKNVDATNKSFVNDPTTATVNKKGDFVRNPINDVDFSNLVQFQYLGKNLKKDVKPFIDGKEITWPIGVGFVKLRRGDYCLIYNMAWLQGEPVIIKMIFNSAANVTCASATKSVQIGIGEYVLSEFTITLYDENMKQLPASTTNISLPFKKTVFNDQENFRVTGNTDTRSIISQSDLSFFGSNVVFFGLESYKYNLAFNGNRSGKEYQMNFIFKNASSVGFSGSIRGDYSRINLFENNVPILLPLLYENFLRFDSSKINEDKTIQLGVKQGLKKQADDAYYKDWYLKFDLSKYAVSLSDANIQLNFEDKTIEEKCSRYFETSADGSKLFVLKINKEDIMNFISTDRQEINFTVGIFLDTNNQDLLKIYNSKDNYFKVPVKVFNEKKKLKEVNASVRMQSPTGKAIPKKVLKGTSTADLNPNELVTNLTSMLSFDTVEVTGFKEEKLFDKIGETSVDVGIKSKLTGVESTITVPITCSTIVDPLPIPYPTPQIFEGKDESGKNITFLFKQSLPKQPSPNYYRDLIWRFNYKNYSVGLTEDTVVINSLTGNLDKSLIRSYLNQKDFKQLLLRLKKEDIEKFSEKNGNSEALFVIKAPLDIDNPNLINVYNPSTQNFEIPLTLSNETGVVGSCTSFVKMQPPTGKALTKTVNKGTSTKDLKPNELVTELKSMLSFDSVIAVGFDKDKTFDTVGNTSVNVLIRSKLTSLETVINVPISVVENPLAYITVPKSVELEKENNIVHGLGTINYTGMADVNIQVNTINVLPITSRESNKVDLQVYKSNQLPLKDGEPLAILSQKNNSCKFHLKAPKENFKKVDIYKGAMLINFELLN